MARRKLIAGNWKMNGSSAALSELDIIAAAAKAAPGLDVALCVPFTLIASAKARVPALIIGAQDVHARTYGAHTGCISATMLLEAGATAVIVGHSERRAEQFESDAAVRAKVEAALSVGLTTILCVGESEAERDAGNHLITVQSQLDGSLPDEASGLLVVAYEPIWAIGTGKTASTEDVAAMHRAIRKRLVGRFGAAGDAVRILYGGSVKSDNAAELFGVEDVDGALVGGASLTAAAFVPVIEAAAG